MFEKLTLQEREDLLRKIAEAEGRNGNFCLENSPLGKRLLNESPSYLKDRLKRFYESEIFIYQNRIVSPVFEEEGQNKYRPHSKTVGFIGETPDHLFGYNSCEEYNKLFDSIYQLILSLVKNGYTTFITGLNQGFEQLCFWGVNKAKKEYNIYNNVVLPVDNPEKYWKETNTLFNKRVFYNSLSKADEVVCLHRNHEVSVTKAYFDKVNEIIDKSDLLVLNISSNTNNNVLAETPFLCQIKKKEIKTISKNGVVL